MTFPIAVDSTMIKDFRACPQRFFRAHIEHWKPKEVSVHLHAGGAYAKGLEVARKAFYEQNLGEDTSAAKGLEALMKTYGDFECPEGSAKSLERMAGALEYYLNVFPFAVDNATPLELPGGKRAVEFSFAIPLDIAHPDTGDPILYCGRADMLVNYAGGIFALDDKTSTSLGPSWSKQWTLRSQFTGYCWAAQQLGINVDGAIVRGISILKTKYDHQEVVTYRSPYLIAKWHNQLYRDLGDMIEMYREWQKSQNSAAWDSDLDSACVEYSGCAFTRVCESPTPDSWLPMYMTKRVWNPLSREEEAA